MENESVVESGKKDLLRRRNCYFLRIGKSMVLPMILTLHHELNSANDLMLQQLLSVLKEMLPLYFGLLGLEEDGLDLKQLKNMTPEIYKEPTLHFSYQFRPTASRYSVITQNKTQKKDLTPKVDIHEEEDEKNLLFLSEFDTQSDQSKQNNEQFQPQTNYVGFSIFRYTLFVEILPQEVSDDTSHLRDSGKKKTISHYFGAT